MEKEKIINRLNKIYNGRYDLSLISKDYKTTDYIDIICSEHGIFTKRLNKAFEGQGCPCCSKKKHKTTEQFIKEAKEIHGDKYDYSNVRYVNNKTKVCIICKEHGKFWVRPDGHLNQKQGCPKCVCCKKLTTEEFIERAKKVHGEKYDYSLTKYINNSTKIKIICPTHGVFEQVPYSHLQGFGCSKCNGKISSREDFIEAAKAIHGDKYDYSKVNYVDSKTKVCIICPKHGEFWQTPNNHTHKENRQGCPKCSESKLETEISEFLNNNKINYIQEVSFPWLNRMRLDFYLPNHNIAIECQGKQHFQSIEYFGGEDGFNKTLERDKLKKKLCEEHNIKMIYYSNLGINYPYEVIEDKDLLIDKIRYGKEVRQR